MRNFIQNGNTITITAHRDLKSGEAIIVNGIFGISTNDVLANSEAEIMLTGVFEIPKKATENWGTGNLIYWEPGSSIATNVMGHNFLIGVAVQNAAALTKTGHVRLNGTSVRAETFAGTDNMSTDPVSGALTHNTTKSRKE